MNDTLSEFFGREGEEMARTHEYYFREGQIQSLYEFRQAFAEIEKAIKLNRALIEPNTWAVILQGLSDRIRTEYGEKNSW